MKGKVHYLLNYQPGDGTRYDFCIFEDPYGGWLVVWPNQCTYRAYIKYKYENELEDEIPTIKVHCLHGNENKYTANAIIDTMKDMVIDGVIC